MRFEAQTLVTSVYKCSMDEWLCELWLWFLNPKAIFGCSNPVLHGSTRTPRGLPDMNIEKLKHSHSVNSRLPRSPTEFMVATQLYIYRDHVYLVFSLKLPNDQECGARCPMVKGGGRCQPVFRRNAGSVAVDEIQGTPWMVLSGNLTKSYWKWSFIVDFPIKNGVFP